MAKKIDFERAGSVDAAKSEDFFETAGPGGPKPAKVPASKKVRVFVDLSAEELGRLNQEVTKIQMTSDNVVSRSKVARDLIMEALDGRQAAQARL